MTTVATESIEVSESHEQFPPVMDDKTRVRYEEACAVFHAHSATLTKEAEAAEILTKDDFAIRINAK